MAFVGYRISPETGDGQPIAAGSTYDEVFTKTFSRIAPEVNAFGAPDMAVRKCDITEGEAAHLESICAAHLDA